MSEPRPSRDSALVERMARVLCKVESLDPDTMICPGEPYRTRHGYIPCTEPHPAWTFYRPMAQRAVDLEWVAARNAERGE